jgi:FMN phosphatase YigB (HAD superfamily)
VQPLIFVDLDGVLVDLATGLSEKAGKQLSQERTQEFTETFYSTIAKMNRAQVAQFYSKLPQTKDCMKLWNAFKPYKPKILTSVSKTVGAIYGKELWCWTNLGIVSDYVYCSYDSSEKQYYASPRSLLIDDYKRNIDQWQAAGGTAIHHVDADSTIQQFNAFLEKTWKYDCY